VIVLNNLRIAGASLALIAFTLTAIAGVGVPPASATTLTVTLNNVTYSADNAAGSAGVTVVSYSGDGGDVVIPASVPIDGVQYAVTAIGESAFYQKKVTAVTIPTTVTTIGDFAFYSDLLDAVILPDALTSIGKDAFRENLLTTVNIPNSVVGIGDWAFLRNNLTSITIGTAVATIGDSAFEENSLTSVVIPDSVHEIGDRAFDFNRLTSLSLGKGLVTIGSFAFASESNPDTFEGITAVTIPDSVISVGTRAFAFNQLTSLTLGNHLTTIGDGAFFYDNLTAVRVPASVTSIGESAFGRSNSQPAIFTFFGGAPTLGSIALGYPTTTTAQYIAPFATEFVSPWNGYTTSQADSFPISTTPTIVGVPKVGLTLTAHAGSWTPAATLSYAWKQVGSTAVLGTASTYVPVATDLAHPLTVTVTASTSDHVQGLKSVATVAVGAGAFTVTPTPVIYGTTQVGKTLTSVSDSWEQDASFGYVWKRIDSTTVSTTVGTGPTYVVKASDSGKKLMVTVTATLDGYTTVSRSSVQTTAVVAGVFTIAPVPTISGVTTCGETVTAVAGSWNAGATLSYVWKRSGVVIPLSTASRYTEVAADIGKTLTVTVTATRSGFTTLSQTSVATAVVVGAPFVTSPVPTITVTGTVSSGFTLNAATGEWSPSSGVVYSYVWSRATTATGTKTVITGATSSTHKLVTADSGKYITVSVTAVKVGYLTTVKTSTALKIAG